MLERSFNGSILCLEKGDLTALEIESIVFYARPDLKLGSGFGSAIAERGGMSIQEELKSFGIISTGEAVVTSAGNLKAHYIVHAVGPRFQEKGFSDKLRATIQTALNAANAKGIKRIAFPPMGSGFYGIPLATCSRIMMEELSHYLKNDSSFDQIMICVLDNREYSAFHNIWDEFNIN